MVFLACQACSLDATFVSRASEPEMWLELCGVKSSVVDEERSTGVEDDIESGAASILLDAIGTD